MTREQAVKWVKFVHDVLYEDKDEEIREALRMAIEALSAEAVHKPDYSYEADMVRRLKEALSVEARPTGEWTITLTDDGFGGENTHLICSVCGSEPLAWSSRKFFRYCPSCGAKMGGGDSE